MEPNTLNIPVLALRGLTVFPHTNLTFDVERRISIKALEVAMETGQEIFLVTQREIGVEKPTEKDLYTMGTVSRVTQILRLGKSSLRVMVEGGRPCLPAPPVADGAVSSGPCRAGGGERRCKQYPQNGGAAPGRPADCFRITPSLPVMWRRRLRQRCWTARTRAF